VPTKKETVVFAEPFLQCYKPSTGLARFHLGNEVAAWSVDRLGRSLMDLLEFLKELHAKGVDLFLHQQGLDTSTPSGRAMFQMMGVFAEFERAMIRERVLTGLARAREQGIQLGRRRLEDTEPNKAAAIRRARAKGTGIRRTARDMGVGVGTVPRLTGEA
jgi:DNA invertase Pin-like site-specific DNA recombinase